MFRKIYYKTNSRVLQSVRVVGSEKKDGGARGIAAVTSFRCLFVRLLATQFGHNLEEECVEKN